MTLMRWPALFGASLLAACSASPAAPTLPPAAVLETASGPPSVAARFATVVSTARGQVPLVENKVKQEAKLENAIWANGGAGGGNPLTFSVQLEQDVLTGATRGYALMVKTNPNDTFFGFISSATIAHLPTGGGTAHLAGVLSDGRPFTIDLTDVEGRRVAAGSFAFKVSQGPSFGGALASGVVRIVRALPAGREFIDSPGFFYDHEIGLPISSADAANVGRSAPLPALPAAAFGLTAPDPIELPNGAEPGQFNILPGIGFDVPFPVGDQLFFPQGVPVFPNHHATLLGGTLLPIHIPPPETRQEGKFVP